MQRCPLYTRSQRSELSSNKKKQQQRESMRSDRRRRMKIKRYARDLHYQVYKRGAAAAGAVLVVGVPTRSLANVGHTSAPRGCCLYVELAARGSFFCSILAAFTVFDKTEIYESVFSVVC